MTARFDGLKDKAWRLYGTAFTPVRRRPRGSANRCVVGLQGPATPGEILSQFRASKPYPPADRACSRSLHADYQDQWPVAKPLTFLGCGGNGDAAGTRRSRPDRQSRKERGNQDFIGIRSFVFGAAIRRNAGARRSAGPAGYLGPAPGTNCGIAVFRGPVDRGDRRTPQCLGPNRQTRLEPRESLALRSAYRGCEQ